MTVLQQAEALATKAHEGQTRRGGEPYINHCKRIVESLKKIGIENENTLAIAWLHDTLEDTDIAGTDILNLSERIFEGVNILTKNEEQDYEDFINEIDLYCINNRSNSLKLIKLCDIRDNIGEGSTEKQREKYLKALSILVS